MLLLSIEANYLKKINKIQRDIDISRGLEYLKIFRPKHPNKGIKNLTA